MSELKACPFCGKEMQKYDNCGDENTVWCANCGAVGPNELTPTRAIEFWNMRRPEDALRAENKRLQALEPSLEWVSVKDKLPEDGKRVIMFATDIVTIGTHNAKVPQWSGDGAYYHGGWYDMVTHWMPLPPAPKE